MGWDHTARQRRLAPIGEYRPETYRVVVHDTFQQFRLRMAALAIQNACRRAGMPSSGSRAGG